MPYPGRPVHYILHTSVRHPYAPVSQKHTHPFSPTFSTVRAAWRGIHISRSVAQSLSSLLIIYHTGFHISFLLYHRTFFHISTFHIFTIALHCMILPIFVAFSSIILIIPDAMIPRFALFNLVTSRTLSLRTWLISIVFQMTCCLPPSPCFDPDLVTSTSFPFPFYVSSSLPW